MHFKGLAWRALDPSSTLHPLSGEGAKASGNRFNPAGMAALYTALDPMTALRECADEGQPLPPTLLVTIAVDMTDVFDATDEGAVQAMGFDPADLGAEDWAERLGEDGLPRSQAFARALAATGHAALLAPSFTAGSGPGDRNLVLWRWSDRAPTLAKLVDPEGRLERA